VEDDPIVRADLRLILEDAGFDVCPDARDGIEAVELARTHRPDLILIDLGLPRITASRRPGGSCTSTTCRSSP
jgi:DNA-binding NarL/FixJ family response regulator